MLDTLTAGRVPAHQGDVAAGARRGGGRGRGGGAAGVGEGPAGEPDDRGPRAQRPRARVRGGVGARHGPLLPFGPAQPARLRRTDVFNFPCRNTLALEKMAQLGFTSHRLNQIQAD